MVTVLEELAPDKSMDRIIAAVKQIRLSASTAARRVHVLVEGVQGLVSDGIKEAKYVSLAVDGSTDNTDTSQLCVFVRDFDGKDSREELPALLPLVTFGKLEDFLKKHGLSMDKVNLIVTDVALAMNGKNGSLVSRIKTVTLDCIIHQSVEK